ncbi:putative membrane protein YfcA [Peribacillus deserti]|uniref:Probable membrane transporter protein n=1 Tax=Peribacillus deserti TaxID=673318 RepID=A0ABS2QLQ1_9BACI|nr:sulfite exporter TauE/SafE family protein [Peribacillus deserti]MBM7693689.1 putative membrane protein YfcA [Peribacillus deserti]
MKKLIILALIGLAAQLVDGSLGMGFGITSTSLLLLLGSAPAAASASVHFAEVVTNAASGISHIRFGNVNKQTVLRLIIPGSIGAFVGACFLSSLPGDVMKPYISGFLLCLGVYIICRFACKSHTKPPSNKGFSKKQLIPLGLVAGFMDATGGGGWGPVTTPMLLAKNEDEPRKVVGSVDTSEFAVSLSATLGFLISLGWSEVNWTWVIAIMIGGIVAAPAAAWLVRKLPAHLLGVLVGGIIILTNLRILMHTGDFFSETFINISYATVVLIWAIAVWASIKRNRSNR